MSVELAPKHVGRKESLCSYLKCYKELADAPVARRSGGRCGNFSPGFPLGRMETLGGTTDKQVKDAEQASVVRVLAPICADKFQRSADVTTNLDALKKADCWKRNQLIEKAGWTTFPGSEPDRKVAEACVTLLNQPR